MTTRTLDNAVFCPPDYTLRDDPSGGWFLIELATGEVVDWFGEWALAVQTLNEQNAPV